MPLSAGPKTAFPKNEDLSLRLDDWHMGKSPGKVHSGGVRGSALPYTEGHMHNLSPEAAASVAGGESSPRRRVEGHLGAE